MIAHAIPSWSLHTKGVAQELHYQAMSWYTKVDMINELNMGVKVLHAQNMQSMDAPD